MAKAKTAQEKIQALVELALKNTEKEEMKQAMLKATELAKKYGFKITDDFKVVVDPNFQAPPQEMDWYDACEVNTYMAKLIAEMLVKLNIEYDFIMDGRKATGLKANCTENTAKAIHKVAESIVKQEASLYRKFATSGNSKGFREMFIDAFKNGIAGVKDSTVAEMAYNALQEVKVTMA